MGQLSWEEYDKLLALLQKTYEFPAGDTNRLEVAHAISALPVHEPLSDGSQCRLLENLFFTAAQYGATELFPIFLQKNANPCAYTESDWANLMTLLASHYPKMLEGSLKTLKGNKVNTCHPDAHGRNALMEYARTLSEQWTQRPPEGLNSNQISSVVRTCVAQGMSPNLPVALPPLVLHLLGRFGDTVCNRNFVAAMLEAGADLGAYIPQEGMTAEEYLRAHPEKRGAKEVLDNVDRERKYWELDKWQMIHSNSAVKLSIDRFNAEKPIILKWLGIGCDVLDPRWWQDPRRDLPQVIASLEPYWQQHPRIKQAEAQLEGITLVEETSSLRGWRERAAKGNGAVGIAPN